MTGGAHLKEAGFFRSAADISGAAKPAESSWESMAARYLEQGQIVLVSPSWVDDLLNTQVRRICQYSILTDGTWIWPSALVYYLKTYHVVLPEEFLMHMESNNWLVPELDDSELDDICNQLQP